MRPLDDKQGVLKIDCVLKSVPLVGEFTKRKDRKVAGFVAFIGEFKLPIFKTLTNGDEISGFAFDPAIARFDGGVSSTVAADGSVLVKWFAHRLPGG